MIAIVLAFLIVQLVFEFRKIVLVSDKFIVNILIFVTGGFLRVKDCHLVEVFCKVICAHNSIFTDIFGQAFLCVIGRSAHLAEGRHVQITNL
jgi:hypothetical protein